MAPRKTPSSSKRSAMKKPVVVTRKRARSPSPEPTTKEPLNTEKSNTPSSSKRSAMKKIVVVKRKRARSPSPEPTHKKPRMETDIASNANFPRFLRAPGHRWQGSQNSPLFKKFNYDIREKIYAYLPPILTADGLWQGLALSCTQAYEEMEEIAAIAVNNLVKKAFNKCEEETGFKPSLIREINIYGDGLSRLRRLTILMPLAAISRTTDNAEKFTLTPLSDHTFQEDAAIVALRSLFTKYFYKVTLLIVKDPIRVVEYDMKGNKLSEKQAQFMHRYRLNHALETVNMLIEMPFHTADDAHEPNTPGLRLSQLNLTQVNTTCIAIRDGTKRWRDEWWGHRNHYACKLQGEVVTKENVDDREKPFYYHLQGPRDNTDVHREIGLHSTHGWELDGAYDMPANGEYPDHQGAWFGTRITADPMLGQSMEIVDGERHHDEMQILFDEGSVDINGYYIMD